MKYKKINTDKKLILILLSAVLLLAFSACEDEAEESSEIVSVSEQVNPLTVETAVELIERDELITEMFINNSLCGEENGSASLNAVDESNEYASFSAIQDLLDNTYTESGEYKKMLLNYPEGHIASVSGIEGRTYVFDHIGSRYNDFVMTATVEVKESGKETEKLITARTRTNTEIEFTALYENGKWLLDKGIYLLNRGEPTEFDEKLSYSALGSFSELKGEVLVIELFISDKESEFTSEEETAYHERINTVFGFLEDEAARYGNGFNITYKKTYFEHSGIIGTRGLDFDIVFAETGFGTLQNFADANCDLSAYDNYVFVVCLDKEAEISFNRYEGSNETEIYFAERVIIGNNADEHELAVSLLKLMGAYGYDEGLCDEYTESLYSVYFPNDIMNTEELTDAILSPVTAYACGISDDLEPLYRVFFEE